MTADFISQINDFIARSESYLIPWAEVIGILWCINIFYWITRPLLNIFGIYPRNIIGLIGIPFSFLLHQNFFHLFFNSIPLYVLGLAILTKDGTIAFCVISAFIVIVSGICVWAFARKGLHIGASGLISGYFGYILMITYTEPGIITIMLAVLAVYYFGGIFIVHKYHSPEQSP